MLKKHILALAVLALSSGAAFADNEAEISQDANTDSAYATIEQIASGQGALTDNYGQIIQSTVTADGLLAPSAQIFQGAVDTQTAVFDLSQASLTSTSIALQNVVLPVDPLGYVSVAGANADLLTNAAVIAQFSAVGTQATVIQTSGADNVSAYLTYSPSVASLSGVSTAAGATTVTIDPTAGTVSYTDSMLAGGNGGAGVTLVLGTGDGAGLNDSNLALIDQGDVPVDREGNDLSGGGFALNNGLFDSAAAVLQAGQNDSAVVYQSGDAQIASIYQDGSLNDAWITQFGNVTGTSGSTTGSFAAIVQLANADVATIYQGGTNNSAYILQH